jgi:hypothetical protein
MEKVTRRSMKRWSGQFNPWFEFVSNSMFHFFLSPLFLLRYSPLNAPTHLSAIDYSQDHMELGAIWNGFSLNETGELAAAIEKTGQAIDATCMTTVRLVSPRVQGIHERSIG